MEFEPRQAQADEELYRKVTSILNKLTPRTFQTLTQQMLDLEIDTVDRLNGVTDLIYEKAVDEAGSTVTVIANLCRCLLPKKVVEEVNGTKKEITFRKILLGKCQKDFEKEKCVEETIHEKLKDLKKQGLSERDLQIKMIELQGKEKRRPLGNIRFIGELFKLKMLTESIMHDCVVKLLKSNDEESFECLCKLLVTIGKDLDHVKAKPRVDRYFTEINKIIQARVTSSRVRFMMQDIVDLRDNDWVPRREDNNPKTMGQNHKEAAEKEKKTQMLLQMAKQEKKQQRGNVGRRDSPRHGAITQAVETWTTVASGPRNVSVDPKKFQNMKVDFGQIPMGGPPQYRPQQAMQGQFPPVSGHSQPPGPYGYHPSIVYPMGQSSPPVYILRAPHIAPMSGMAQYHTPPFEIRTREKKIIRIKDPSGNKSVTQEILNREPSGCLTGSTCGTPNNITPNVSGQSSSSSTPPLTSQQQAEANVRAQFAAQVAAALEDKSKKPEYTIQKPPSNNKAVVEITQVKEPVETKKESVKETEVNNAVSNVTEETKLSEGAVETLPKDGAVKSRPKEATQGSKPSEGVIGPKSLVSSVEATTLANEKISNVRIEIFTADEVRNNESQKSSASAVSDVVKTDEIVKSSEEAVNQSESVELPVSDTKSLNGPVMLSQEEPEETEEVLRVENQDELEATPGSTAETPVHSKATEGEQVAEPEATAEGTGESEDLPEETVNQFAGSYSIGEAVVFGGGLGKFLADEAAVVASKPIHTPETGLEAMDFEPRQAQADEELYHKVTSILNKLTPRTFQTLTQQMIDLEIDTVDRLNGVTDLIYEKAVDEAGSTVTAIANLCRCLLLKKVVEEVNGAKKKITFRKILLNRCQKEFEKEKSVEETIHEKLEDLKKQGLGGYYLYLKMAPLLDEEEERKKNRRRRKLGNIRFIGELFKLRMLTESIMHDCVVKLLKRNDEESFECLCELLIIIGKDLDHKKAKGRIDQYFTQINKIIQAEITSTRVRSMMRAIVNLRKNHWVPQMVEQEKKLQRGNVSGCYSPRRGTIPPADETWTTVARGPRNVSVDPKKFQNIKRPVDSKNTSLGTGGKGYGAWARGSSGGTGAVGAGAGPSAAAGSATDGSVAEADNRPANRYSALAGERKCSAPARASSGYSRRQEPRSPVSGGGRRGPFPQGEREKALETVRAVTQPKRNAQQRYGGWESPRPIPEAALPAEPAVPDPTAATSIQELTEEAMKKKTLSIIDEYLNIRDTEEAADCLKELRSPSRHHVFVEVAFHHAMEKKISDRNAIGKLIHFLLRDGVLTAQQYLNGLDEIFQLAEYIEIDIPQLWNYLGELMGPSAFAGNLNLDELFNRVFNCVSKHKAAKLFVYMLESATSDKSQEDVAAILSRYNVTLNTFFDNEEEAKEFAKDRKIEFALGQNPSSQKTTASTNEHSPRIQEELRTVILKRKARNEEAFDWIDKNVSPADTKESPFIRALVTAVCEGAMDRGEGGACKCNVEKLKDRKILLQRYIDSNTSLEVQAVYAVQALFVGLDYPPGFIKSYFDSLYDEEIITEESFFAWQNGDEEPGKGVTVTNAQEFFRWLKSAEEAGDDS